MIGAQTRDSTSHLSALLRTLDVLSLRRLGRSTVPILFPHTSESAVRAARLRFSMERDSTFTRLLMQSEADARAAQAKREEQGHCGGVGSSHAGAHFLDGLKALGFSVGEEEEEIRNSLRPSLTGTASSNASSAAEGSGMDMADDGPGTDDASAWESARAGASGAIAAVQSAGKRASEFKACAERGFLAPGGNNASSTLDVDDCMDDCTDSGGGSGRGRGRSRGNGALDDYDECDGTLTAIAATSAMPAVTLEMHPAVKEYVDTALVLASTEGRIVSRFGPVLRVADEIRLDRLPAQRIFDEALALLSDALFCVDSAGSLNDAKQCVEENRCFGFVPSTASFREAREHAERVQRLAASAARAAKAAARAAHSAQFAQSAQSAQSAQAHTTTSATSFASLGPLGAGLGPGLGPGHARSPFAAGAPPMQPVQLVPRVHCQPFNGQGDPFKYTREFRDTLAAAFATSTTQGIAQGRQGVTVDDPDGVFDNGTDEFSAGAAPKKARARKPASTRAPAQSKAAKATGAAAVAAAANRKGKANAHSPPPPSSPSLPKPPLNPSTGLRLAETASSRQKHAFAVNKVLPEELTPKDFQAMAKLDTLKRFIATLKPSSSALDKGNRDRHKMVAYEYPKLAAAMKPFLNKSSKEYYNTILRKFGWFESSAEFN